MIKSIGGIVLPSQTRWTDRLSYIGVKQSTEYTLGGRQIVWNQRLIGGRPITLTWDKEEAWLSWDTVINVQQLAQNNNEFTFVWGDIHLQTRFDSSPLTFAEVEGYGETELNRFYGQIKLIEVV